MEVTELEISKELWLTISQFTLNEETEADVNYYGFLILFLLILLSFFVFSL